MGSLGGAGRHESGPEWILHVAPGLLQWEDAITPHLFAQLPCGERPRGSAGWGRWQLKPRVTPAARGEGTSTLGHTRNATTYASYLPRRSRSAHALPPGSDGLPQRGLLAGRPRLRSWVLRRYLKGAGAGGMGTNGNGHPNGRGGPSVKGSRRDIPSLRSLGPCAHCPFTLRAAL